MKLLTTGTKKLKKDTNKMLNSYTNSTQLLMLKNIFACFLPIQSQATVRRIH